MRTRRPRLRAALATSACLAASLALGACSKDDATKPPPAPAAAKPSIPRSLVIVDVSGARYDEVVRADGGSAMPAFRALERDGAFFAQATASAGWDAPAIAGLFSGLSPDRCTVHGRPYEGQRPMIGAIETLAETLTDGGYATAAFTSGGHVARRSGLEQGFSTWVELADDAARLAAAKAWLEGPAKGVPHLLFVHAAVAADGAPVDAPARAARLAALDGAIATWRALADADRGPDGGWFVVLSDHGDVLAAREGGLDPGDTGTLDAQIHVPLAIVGPGFPPARFDASVSLLDVAPTIRDLVGLPPHPLMEGRTWRPILGAPTSPGRPALAQGWRRFATKSNPVKQHLVSVRTRTKKFTAEFDVGSGTWTESLFDLESDPQEEHPLAVGDVERLGAEFAHAVATIREALGKGQALRNDRITSAYFARDAK